MAALAGLRPARRRRGRGACSRRGVASGRRRAGGGRLRGRSRTHRHGARLPGRARRHPWSASGRLRARALRRPRRGDGAAAPLRRAFRSVTRVRSRWRRSASVGRIGRERGRRVRLDDASSAFRCCPVIGCRSQVRGQPVEHLRRAILAQPRCLRSVDAVQVGALLGPGQRGAAGGLGTMS